MSQLLVNFITSLDGYGATDGWPGWWGLEGPEYLTGLGEQPERDETVLMGANAYQLMCGFAAQFESDAGLVDRFRVVVVPVKRFAHALSESPFELSTSLENENE